MIVVSDTRATSCPPWFYFNNDTQQCECGEHRTLKIRCNQPEQKIEISDGYCVSNVHNKYYAGMCLYAHVGNYTDRMFSVAPRDPERFEEYMCGHYNRRGLLCGRCIDGYGPAVYSLEMKCVDCSKLSLGVAVVLFGVLEFVPITLFFIFVLVTRLNITNGPSVRRICLVLNQTFTLQLIFCHKHQYHSKCFCIAHLPFQMCGF